MLEVSRRALFLTGLVQGVGFRPFACRLATRLGVRGFVRNTDGGGVSIEVEGPREVLDQFVHRLLCDAPPPAQVDRMTVEERAPVGTPGFDIVASRNATEVPHDLPRIAPDLATCDDCLREMHDATDRRHHYPFISCTACGPRWTILRALPLDREHTTMAAFAHCPACAAEYWDPCDRRFHAQASACERCGPRLSLVGDESSAEPVREMATLLRAGEIAAVKGIGGFHLVCDATSDEVVARLRQRKNRPDKPFAVMVRDLATAEAFVEISPAERELLASSARPIVLLRRSGGAPLAPAVSRQTLLGIMLPHAPLHHLLFAELGGLPLVVTSGNRSDEPIAIEQREADSQLGSIADSCFTHDREIRTRCDDSVARVIGGQPTVLRRGRGFAPAKQRLPLDCRRAIVALGAQLKATVGFARGREAVLSQHLGDLDGYQTYRAFIQTLDQLERLLGCRPGLLAHDAHPDYVSTRHALAQRDIDRVAVQHHHAHMASCMVEHGLDEAVIGVTFDGGGHGVSGTVWGGEFLVGDYRQFHRAAHLREVRMPGGELAIREPWRMSAAHLLDAELDPHRYLTASPELALIERIEGPFTSSIGRLFDAVAVLAGISERMTFEGQAAMALESLAAAGSAEEPYRFEIGDRDPLVIDARPVIERAAAEARVGTAVGDISARFHRAVVDMIVKVCQRLRERFGVSAVVLSGGVFANGIVTSGAASALAGAGFRVHCHREVPPGDGGISLGQLAVAAAQDRS